MGKGEGLDIDARADGVVYMWSSTVLVFKGSIAWEYGYAVAILDGVALVGAPGENAVYLHALVGGAWMQSAKFMDATGRLGEALAVSWPYMLASAPYEASSSGSVKAYAFPANVNECNATPSPCASTF